LAGQTTYAPYPTPLPHSREQGQVIANTAQNTAAGVRVRLLYDLANNRLDSAIAGLEAAVQKAPGDAKLLSDLSALYGERAHQQDRPDDYVAALEMADRAFSATPSAETAFNRALALEHLFLDGAASLAWMRFLASDDSSPWADEAKAHLAQLASPRRLKPQASPALTILALRRLKEQRGMQTTNVSYEASAQTLMARHLDSLGQPAEAWKYRYRDLAKAHSTPWGPPPQLIATLDSAVTASLKQGRPSAALDFQSYSINVAKKFHQQKELVLGRLRRSRIEAVLGQVPKAQRDFERACADLKSIPSWSRKDVAAAVDLARAEIAATEERAAAIAADFPSTEPWAPELLSASADFAFRLGDTDAAEDQLEAALDELERRREQVAPGNDRIAYLDQVHSIYERLIALELNLARPEKSLEVLERFRARTLLDRLQTFAEPNGANISPLNGRELRQRMPANTLLVVYAVIEKHLVTWLIRPEGIVVITHQSSWEDVSTLVERLHDAERRQEVLTELDRYLVRPWQNKIRIGDRLIFVPTSSLYRVPFAALVDSGSGRFLIQDHAVGVASSASEFVAAMEHDRTLSHRPLGSVLLVGDPTIEKSSDLPGLPGTAHEIDLLKGIYGGLDVRALLGGKATPANVLSLLERSDIVHLAAHALSDRDDPGRSHLMLSATEGTSGDLSARDIVRLRLTRTRVVMTAACSTQIGPVSPSEGALTLSSSFLATGVPAVVGSLWPVEDASTTRLSVRFHQELRRGADALSALRTAQLEEIESALGRTDWNWASFELFGGVVAREP